MTIGKAISNRKRRLAVLKYSLGTLFVVMAIVALGCAAIANFSPLWAQTMVTLTVGALLAGLLVAISGRGRAGAFAAGFAAVGGVYFLLTFVQFFGLREQLLTNRVVNKCWSLSPRSAVRLDRSGFMRGMSGNMGMPGAGFGTMPGMGDPTTAGFMFGTSSSSSGIAGTIVVTSAPRELQDIAHCLWTLLLALLGGAAGQVIHGISRKAEAST
jgi:hypothetical protein